jgi:ribosome-binding factor A
MTTRRQQRISELLHEELSILISTALTDPRLADAMITVTDVQVSPDLRNARVYFEHLASPESSYQLIDVLNRAEGFLRHALAENLNLRVVPELTFHVDETCARSRRIDEILDTLASQTAQEASHEFGPSDGDAD